MAKLTTNLKPGSPEYNALLDAPLPKVAVNEATRELTKEYAHKFRGSVRVATGRFMTEDEHEAYRQRVLATPLP